MGQTTDQIKSEIDSQRQELGDNLDQLEATVRRTMDWKAQYEERPLLGIGLAFGAGVLASMLIGGSEAKSREGHDTTYAPYSASASTTQTGPRGDGRRTALTASAQHEQPRSPEMNEITQTLDNIKGALLGLGASKLRTFLAEAVPGFQQEYEQAREKRHAPDDTRIDRPSGASSDYAPDMRRATSSYVTSAETPAGGAESGTPDRG